MAIDFTANYPGQSGPITSGYPQGSFVNVSAPAALDGTPYEQAWANDVSGFLQGLIKDAAIGISGVPDTADASDYKDALNILINQSAGRSQISGLTVENETVNPTNTIQFNPGIAPTNVIGRSAELVSSLNKSTIATWVPGPGGGLFSGAVAASTTYHLFIIKDPINNLVDCGFSTNILASDRPVAYTEFARVASLKTDGGGLLPGFEQRYDSFTLRTPFSIRTGSLPVVAIDTTELIETNLPSGIGATAKIRGWARHITGTTRGWIGGVGSTPAATTALQDYDLQVDDTASLTMDVNLDEPFTARIVNQYFTNSPSAVLHLFAHGWTDLRGK
jgi:hypothetical protein